MLLIRLPALSVIDLIGKDAAAILHNLTTNDIKRLTAEVDGNPAANALPPGEGLETFITNVRGKCLGHVVTFAIANGYRLIGSPGQSAAIAEHADRYTIREDATPELHDEKLAAWIVMPDDASHLDSPPDQIPTAVHLSGQSSGNSSETVTVYRLPWVAGGTLFLLPVETVDEHPGIIASCLDSSSDIFQLGDESVFHDRRIAAGFPWYGIDLSDAHLPQEADREQQTISFTKGCYLGQETVARLDALGQVQKKLVRWSLDGLPKGVRPVVDDKLHAENAAPDAKPIGRVTGVGDGIAMGYIRRSHFDVGSVAVGRVSTGSNDGATYTATVLPPVTAADTPSSEASGKLT